MKNLHRWKFRGLLVALGVFTACSDPAAPAPPPAMEKVVQLAPVVPPPAPPDPTFEGKIEPGQTFSEVLSAYKLPDGTIHEVTTALSSVVDLKRVRPGHLYRIELTPQGDFKSLYYEASRELRYRVRSGEGGFQASREEVDVEARPHVVSGVIRTNLIDAVLEQGENIHFAMGLLEAFQWDINFYTDVQQGDTFKALVERVYVDGKPERIGQVMIAQYHGKTVGDKEAVLFHDEYFDPRGKYLQRSFLTTPLDVLKVTSRFGQRFHPILGILRAHKGVDYGARTGTPVWSVSEGRVAFAGNRGDGYGKQVVIEHAGGYSTRYAHLSRLSVASGQRVRQKMKVGEVGATGLASGPHLHFEIIQGGAQVNPARLKMLPTVERSVKDLPAFLAERQRLAELLESTEVAMADDAARRPTLTPGIGIY